MLSFVRKIVPMMVIAGLFTGCSSIVRKPEINGVRKVAIVSLYADQMIPWTGGTGRVDNFDLDTKHRVALQAYKAFSTEFKRLKWEVIPMNQVVASSYYKKEFGPQQVDKDSNILAKAVNVGQTIKNEGYFTAPGLFPIELPKQNDKNNRSMASLDLRNFSVTAKKDFPTQMGELARDLKVDAVVLVGLDYCYTGETAVLGNGTARFTAGSYVRAFNGDKQEIVQMAPIEKRCSGERGNSDKTVAMVGGSIGLSKAFDRDAFVTGLTEATQRSAQLTVAALDKAITAK